MLQKSMHAHLRERGLISSRCLYWRRQIRLGNLGDKKHLFGIRREKYNLLKWQSDHSWSFGLPA